MVQAGHRQSRCGGDRASVRRRATRGGRRMSKRTTSRIGEPPPKVLITKIGLDGHDRGSRVVAAFLRDAGMEVLYTPPWQEIGQVVRLAEEEDVDVIGISSLATDHLLVPKLIKALKKAGLGEIPVVVGGIVPDADERKLKAAGVRHVFHPGAAREEIVSKVAELAAEAQAAKSGEVLA